MSKPFKVTLDPESNDHDLLGRPVESIANYLFICNADGRRAEPTWDDVVFYDGSFTAEDVKKSLVNHDGYNPNIRVEEV